jgi:hypothetical protein
VRLPLNDVRVWPPWPCVKRTPSPLPSPSRLRCVHQENAVFTFRAFSLFASKESRDTRKYHLLIKRNPLYFLGAFFFFHLLEKLGLLSTKVLYFGKVENTHCSFPRRKEGCYQVRIVGEES